MSPAATAVKAAADVLFTPVKVGAVELSHRIVMAPLTRCRAPGGVPTPLMATYYGQRATAGGLIIAEATAVSETSYGYPNTPGIHTKEQVEAWKPVVKAVHDKGGKFFLQIWHVGRASIPAYQPGGALPFSSSATPIASGEQALDPNTFTPTDYPTPRALEIEEIKAVIETFRKAAANAREAGFDGVEIHGANGYLVDQFLKDGTNKRTDKYGGPIENRARFAIEILEACSSEIGSGRVGIRLSPFGGFLDSHDSHPYALNSYLVEEFNKLGLAYVHFVEPRVGGNDDRTDVTDSIAPFRQAYKGTLLSAGGHTSASAIDAVKTSHSDLVVFGRQFIANPDLVERIKTGAALNKYDRDTFYAGGEKGYIDYPFL